jgi:hypothetical protein
MLVPEPAEVGDGDTELVGNPRIAGAGRAEPSRAGGDAVRAEDRRAGAGDLPDATGRPEPGGGDDDIELGWALIAQQRDHVGQGGITADQLYVYSRHRWLPSSLLGAGPSGGCGRTGGPAGPAPAGGARPVRAGAHLSRTGDGRPAVGPTLTRPA